MIVIDDWFNGIKEKFVALYGSEVPFYYDNIINVGNILQAKEKTKDWSTKYPCVIMLSNVAKTYLSDGKIAIKPLILIVTDSKKDYLRSERLNATYRGVLYPICDILKKVIGISVCTEIDRDFISGAFAEASVFAGITNLFNDSLDGIELKNFTVTIDYECN